MQEKQPSPDTFVTNFRVKANPSEEWYIQLWLTAGKLTHSIEYYLTLGMLYSKITSVMKFLSQDGLPTECSLN